MRSQQQHVPPVHASKVLAQHAMSYHQREPVEDSTYDLTTGDSTSASFPPQIALQEESSIEHGWSLLLGPVRFAVSKMLHGAAIALLSSRTM